MRKEPPCHYRELFATALLFDLDGDFLPPPSQRLLAGSEIDIDAVRSLDGGTRILNNALPIAWDDHFRPVGIVADVRRDGPFPRLGAVRSDTDFFAPSFIGSAGDVFAPEQDLSTLPVRTDLVGRIRGHDHLPFFVGGTARQKEGGDGNNYGRCGDERFTHQKR